MVNYKKYLFFLIFIGFILSLILLFYYCKIKNVYLHPGGGISRIMKGNNLTNTWTNIDDYVTITYIDYIFVILLVLYLCLLIWLRININKKYGHGIPLDKKTKVIENKNITAIIISP